MSAAQRGDYLKKAASELTEAQHSGAADPAYTSAITRLDQIVAVPETNVTTAQMAEVRSDTIALNQFFGTPGLYGFAAP